jgi:hypothetical protein
MRSFSSIHLKVMIRYIVIVFIVMSLAGTVLACLTLEVGFEKTPTHDHAAVGTLASLMVTGTHSAHRATQLAIPITPVPVTAFVSGRICYPGDRTPEMTLYFSQPEEGHIIEMPIDEDQEHYQIELEPGSYYIFAWVESFQIGGMYTQAVLCGFEEECTDHSPLLISLTAGQVVDDIDICDWVYPESALPFPIGAGITTRQTGS